MLRLFGRLSKTFKEREIAKQTRFNLRRFDIQSDQPPLHDHAHYSHLSPGTGQPLAKSPVAELILADAERAFDKIAGSVYDKLAEISTILPETHSIETLLVDSYTLVDIASVSSCKDHMTITCYSSHSVEAVCRAIQQQYPYLTINRDGSVVTIYPSNDDRSMELMAKVRSKAKSQVTERRVNLIKRAKMELRSIEEENRVTQIIQQLANKFTAMINHFTDRK